MTTTRTLAKGTPVAANVSPFTTRPRKPGAGWALGTYEKWDGQHHVVRFPFGLRKFGEGRVVAHDGDLASFYTD